MRHLPIPLNLAALTAIVGLLGGGLVACLDPLVSDEPPPAGLVWAADRTILPFASTFLGRAQIGANDGIDGDLLRLYSGFAEGKPIKFWDYGETNPTAIPLYLLVRAKKGGAFATAIGDFEPIGHLPIFDAVPGDDGYSPMWKVVLLPVTAQWTGGILASFAAVEEATKLGLVTEPIPLAAAVNCPVVLPEARLEMPGDAAALGPKEAYYKGYTVTYFDHGLSPLENDITNTTDVLELRREGGEPLSERFRGVDLTDDGDWVDTNHIFAATLDDPAYTGLVRRIEVVVDPKSDSIDTTGSDAEADFMAVSDLFELGDGNPIARAGRVRAFYPSTAIYNRPIAPKPETPQ